jgi:hypothetical protein
MVVRLQPFFLLPAYSKQTAFSAIQSQLHSVPPWVAAFGFAMALAYISDRLRHRWLFSLIPGLVCLAGFSILAAHPASTNVKYAALFLAVSGVFSSNPILVGWFNTNLAGHLRRSTGSAFQVAFGNIGGIIASYSFPAADGPRYTKGYAICIGFVCLSMLSSTAYAVSIIAENRQRDRAEGNVEMSAEEKERAGDLNPDYRYIL